jgi:transcription initiation factor IIE alpha subunit
MGNSKQTNKQTNNEQMDENIKCSFCGHTFKETEGISACQGCPVSNCAMIKCPNCGYDQLPEPKSLKWIKHLFKTIKTSNHATNK